MDLNKQSHNRLRESKQIHLIMKIAFYVVAATCLISGLTAADLSAFDDSNDLENVGSNFLNVYPSDDDIKIIWPTTAKTSPQPTTTTTQSTTTTTTTTPSTTTTTTTRRPHPPRPTTTTRRPLPPRPTTTTRRPLPPPPSSPIRNPQIYNNRVNSLAPFASHLVNVVLNKGGRQKTVQRNQILYNIKSTVPKFMEEESNE